MNRRNVLKATGISLALPVLETFGQSKKPPPPRLVTIGATLGLYSDWWFPKTAGIDYEASQYLKLIDPFRDRYTLFSGLEHKNQSGRQAHNSEITWLTSAEHPGLDGFKNTLSLDQAAAKHNGYITRFPSIVMGTVSPQSQSYTASGVMVPADTSPSKIFTNLFLQGDPKEVARHRQSLNDGGSILDHLQSETSMLKRQVSSTDKIKLDNYLDAVREAEIDLTQVQAWMHRPKPELDTETHEALQMKVAMKIVGSAMVFIGFIQVFLSASTGAEITIFPMLLYFSGMALWAHSSVKIPTVRYLIIVFSIMCAIGFIELGEVLFWHKYVIYWGTIAMVVFFMFQNPKKISDPAAVVKKQGGDWK